MIESTAVNAAAVLIADFVGLRPTDATEARLMNGLEQRCRARGVAIDRYLAVLATDCEERQELVDLVTVPETSWFREPAHFAAMVAALAPPASRARPITVWSAGCAGGAEPYSVAMAFEEAGITEFRIVATDVSRRAVARATNAVYREHELRGLSAGRRQRFMAPTAAGWQVIERLRERVTVQQANLLDDPPPVTKGSCDVVLCRNVFIYLRRDRIAACLDRFHGVLAPGGRLFVGASESLWGVKHRFTVERVSGAFVHRRQDDAPLARPAPQPVKPAARQAASPARLKKMAPVEPMPLADELRREGEAASRDGRHDDAVAAFRKAAYLEPADPVAHLELGFALEAAGGAGAGRRAFQAARRALERSDRKRVADRLDGWSVEAIEAVLDTKLGVRSCP